ncbi:MAG: hypothetical protein LBL90_04155 [Prevotellaceae bacterium]|jgi:hypothetical protein|nr:hypothetical protein [Prevotellaceae bacterium]
MPFVEEILKYNSLSIVGLEKNTGKTETLNYVLKRLPSNDLTIAVSSVGIDGERVDQVTQTRKPEIYLKKGVIFTTSEKHYRKRRLLSELLEIDDEQTALGRLMTARALIDEKIILSGPSSTAGLERWVNKLQNNFGVQLCVIDGALSRLSLASPAVSQSMILATGAALSIDIPTLVRKTLFVVDLINLPLTQLACINELDAKERGIWLVDKDGDIYESSHFTSFSPNIPELANDNSTGAIYLSGALTDSFLKKTAENKNCNGTELIVRDFTRIFTEPLTYKKFIGNGGKLTVLRKSKLIAITVNPFAPNGTALDSDELCRQLMHKAKLPVYDIVKNGY